MKPPPLADYEHPVFDGPNNDVTQIANRHAEELQKRINELLKKGYYIWHPWMGEPKRPFTTEIIGCATFVKQL